MPAHLFRRPTWIIWVILPLLAGQLLACCRARRPAPSIRERSGYLRAEFARLDSNGDGKISHHEFAQNSQPAIGEAERLVKAHSYQPLMVSQLYAWDQRARTKFPEFSQIDINGDGLISFHKEFLGFSSLMFARFCGWDLNGDGLISKHEFVTAPQPAEVERDEEYLQQAKPVDAAAEKNRRQRLGLEFGLRDRNSDGRVTWSELITMQALLPPITYEGMDALGAFLNADANYDGGASRDEFLAHARDPKRFDKDYLVMEEKVFRLRDLDGNKTLSFLEFVQTGENLARQFVGCDQDEDGVLVFDDVKDITWMTGGKNVERARCYFARLDTDQDRRVSWKEYRGASARGIAVGVFDLIEIDNVVSRKEWDAVEQEYRDGQSGKPVPPQSCSYYATNWVPGIFELITFEDIDANRDGELSWKEFDAFPQ